MFLLPRAIHLGVIMVIGFGPCFSCPGQSIWGLSYFCPPATRLARRRWGHLGAAGALRAGARPGGAAGHRANCGPGLGAAGGRRPPHPEPRPGRVRSWRSPKGRSWSRWFKRGQRVWLEENLQDMAPQTPDNPLSSCGKHIL